MSNKTEFQKAAKPLMDYMKTLPHPHMTAIVTLNDAELLEGKEMVQSVQHDD